MENRRFTRKESIKFIKENDLFYEFANLNGHDDYQLLAIIGQITDEEKDRVHMKLKTEYISPVNYFK